MDKVSKGRVRAVKEAVAREIPEGSLVLEIGCGTGELASMLIERDCIVEGFDLSPSMIEVAKERIAADNLENRFKVKEMGVDGMDGLPMNHFDAVVSTLVFSEFSDDERRFALKHAARVLKSDGLIVIADEVVPMTVFRRIIHSIIRLPMVAVTYLAANQSTRPIGDLTGEIRSSGFRIKKEERSHGDSFAMVVATKKEDGKMVK
jgi:ubiquinone/menaquinone biosynthesis C-methylase UbiE